MAFPRCNTVDGGEPSHAPNLAREGAIPPVLDARSDPARGDLTVITPPDRSH